MTVSIIDSRRVRNAAGALALTFVVSGGCASVPYQAMSDARQAIEAAEPVVDRDGDAAPLLERARDRLEDAERQLHAGEYKPARATAEEAKGLAIEAREQAREDDSSSP